MKLLYPDFSANAPRQKTDVLFADDRNRYHFDDFWHQTFSTIEDFQLLREDLWQRFVTQFREEDADFNNGWRGEYWGKMMRGACFCYAYTRNPNLYALLTDTVRDMLSTADETGRISSYGVHHEFTGWDIWARKYVLLGMQYFLEICTDPDLSTAIIESMCRQVDYIIAKIGDGEGKKPITEATLHWRGLNSSSLLEPIVRLYSITKKEAYLDFATYIVSCGGTDVDNIFRLAYEDQLYPYQYPVTKAYEMTSCFEGLLEYYRVTGDPLHRDAVVRYADKVLESDFTVIGSSGCTHEQFDHSTVRQANTDNFKVMQETCVTVTLMKFFYQLTALTGDSKYVDAFETALYNAYLGAVNTDKVIEPALLEQHPDWAIEALPFDSYSPLTAGTRGNGIGGLQRMSDNHYYGCCACIGSAGLGLIPKMALMTKENGTVLNLYANGTMQTKTPAEQDLTLRLTTEYPKCGLVTVQIQLESPDFFALSLRIPAWSAETKVTVNGESTKAKAGYWTLERLWKNGDTVQLMLDMRTRVLRPIPYGTQILMTKTNWALRCIALPTFDREDPMAKNHVALVRGPLVLAQENRLGYSVDDPVEIAIAADETVAVTFPEEEIAPYPHLTELCVPLTDGTQMHVTDYASAGKLWTEESKMAAWILTKESQK